MTRKTLIVVIYLFSSFVLNAQENNNQISLNADDLIPALFSSDANTFNLVYRRKISDKKHLRLGFKYFYEEENEIRIGLKPGIDFLFKKADKWKFSYGVDAAFIHTNSYTSERKYYEFAAIPFLRAEFFFSNSFSISTEPGFFLRLTEIKDVDNSPIDNSNSILSSGLSGIGFVKFNISF